MNCDYGADGWGLHFAQIQRCSCTGQNGGLGIPAGIFGSIIPNSVRSTMG